MRAFESQVRVRVKVRVRVRVRIKIRVGVRVRGVWSVCSLALIRGHGACAASVLFIMFNI